MDQDVSSSRSANARIHREEALPVAVLLAFVGGYLDAYTWIVHNVFANAQTANMVLLWIHAMTGEWARAIHYIPPLIAFILGVIMASCLRRFVGVQAGRSAS